MRSAARALVVVLCCATQTGVALAEAEEAETEDVPVAGASADASDDELTADEEIDALLGPSITEATVVTANRTEQSILDAPVSVSVVDEQTIETSAADNIGDLVRGVPGVNIVQVSARDINFSTRSPGTSLAGGGLALVDGRSIYQDFFGLVMWDLVPADLSELEQVEVVRGPGSAMWGANALTGVVHLRTKSPRDMAGGLAAVGGGELGTKSAKLRWAQAWERFSFKLAGAYLEQRPWERSNNFSNGDPIPMTFEFENEGTKQPKIDLRLDFDARKGRRWSYRAGWAQTTGLLYTGIGPFAIADGSEATYADARLETKRHEVKFYVNTIDGDATNLLIGTDFFFDSKTWVGEITGRRAVGQRHALVYGGTGRLVKFDLSLAPGEDERVEFGAFVEDSIAIGKKSQLNIGLRLDHFDTIGLTVSPRSSFLYRIREWMTLRVALNRAFRAPSLINNYLQTAVPNLYTLPNGNDFFYGSLAEGGPDLEEERVDALELGLTGVVGNSLVSVAVYRNETGSQIDFAEEQYYSDESPPTFWNPDIPVPECLLVQRFQYRNVPSGKVIDEGFELGVQSDWGRG
ncbi:MAG: TonB-dependent receptor, partial [Acidobacteriota bacterium]